jgi:hypothetical protein
VNNISTFILWLMVFVGIMLVSVMGSLTGISLFLNRLNMWDKDLSIGLIGFSGSIIGGFLTLIGVYFTLKHSESSKYQELLPEKIHHLEQALELIKNPISKLNNTELNLFDLSYHYIDYKEPYYKLRKEEIDTIKDKLIYVDSNSYKRAFATKKALQQIIGDNRKEEISAQISTYMESEIRYDGLRFEMSDEKRNEFEPIREQAQQLNDFLKQLMLTEYADLERYLVNRHDKLTKRFK